MKSVSSQLSLNVGELIVCPGPAVISTILGSCVSVCLFSKNGKGGGIIHYALPCLPGPMGEKESLRYGEFAILKLVQELSRLTGEDPTLFRAKVVGGADEVQPGSGVRIGSENVAAAKRLLSDLKIPIVGESVGGSSGRKILFHVPSGRLQVAKLGSDSPRARRRRVLIVDDAKVIRDLLNRILSEDPELQVVGFAAHPLEAEEKVRTLKPDVITLDIHMPHMTGVEWLARLLPVQPIPVVMISSLQLQEGNEVFKALELGAVDYIQKPSLHELPIVSPMIREKVKNASFAKVIQSRPSAVARRVSFRDLDRRKILAIGASTGGTEAIKSVLTALPADIPPTVVVQHIPAVFSKAFADRLNALCPFEVKEAEDGDELKPSRVLIAPGGRQMKLQKNGHGFRVAVNDEAPVNRHKPSVDYLFRSVAELAGANSVGVILTGMGADGANGLLEMRKKGARTIGQDEASCVVYGMPRAAWQLGAVEKAVGLSDIAVEIVRLFEKRTAA